MGKKPFHAMSDDFDELDMPIEEAVTVALNQPEEFNEEWAQIEAEAYATGNHRSSFADTYDEKAFIAGARWMFEQLRGKK